MKLTNNPPFRFTSQEIEWIDAPVVSLQVFEEECRSLVSKNTSPDIAMTYSVNPYRGCFHACAYCYARPSHQYLEFGAGTDFERKIVVKVNAAEKLREEFMRTRWRGETVTFSGNTDCYQPLELEYKLTRKCLEVCNEFKNPVGIITKGAIIERDVELLAELSEKTSVMVCMSIASDDDEISKLLEPGAPRPSRRFKAMKRLSDAGVPVALALAPVIPGLTESHIPRLLERAHECGAREAFMTLIRLPLEVQQIFTERITEAFPTRHQRVLNKIKRLKGGKLNHSEFGTRMRGEGNEWDAIRWMFDHTCDRLGLNVRRDYTEPGHLKPSNFERPSNQLTLF